MSLSLYIEQILMPSLWNDASEPWTNNAKARQRSQLDRERLMGILCRENRPVSLRELSERANLTLPSARNLLKPAIDAGTLRRIFIDDVVFVEMVIQ